MNPEFHRCINNQKIKKFIQGKNLVIKELNAAISDFEQAKISFTINKNYKWSTIQCYYSMFHAARSLLYLQNYREKSHHCLIVALKALYVEKGLLPIHFIEGLKKAKTLRENADYYDQWSEIGVEVILRLAEEFLEKTKLIVYS